MEEEKKSPKKKSLLFLILLLLVLGAGGSYYWYKAHQNPKELIAGEYPHVKDAHKMTAKEMKEFKQKEVDETQFTLTIFPEATVHQKTSEGTIYIKNEPVNAYPINVKVILDENNQLVYESGMIQPGFEVTKIKLAQPLEKGEYKATAFVDIYDNKTKEKRGTTQAVVDITVNE